MKKFKYNATTFKYIPKEELEEGAWYLGKCRNASVARWHNGMFYYHRIKFGNIFQEEINCPDNDDGFDVFIPFQKIEDPDLKLYKIDEEESK